MTLEARYEAFGERSDSLVPEAIWCVHEEDEIWPAWDALVEAMCEWKEVTTEQEVLARMQQALLSGEATARLFDEGDDFRFTIPQDTYDRITRRHMDRTMPRKDREEQF